MSNRDPDARYENLTQAIEFVTSQVMKNVRTALPGNIVRYDAATSRAQVQPAIDLLMTDNTAMPRAPILDVPVMHPAGGGYAFRVPLDVGDPVMLLFSSRSIARFKATLERGAPLSDDIMAEQDAVALPGFVPRAFTPVGDAAMQSIDGATHVSIDGDEVTVQSANTTIRTTDGMTTARLTPGLFQVDADTIRFNYDGGSVEYP